MSEIEENDSITDLRIILNQDFITRDRFIKYQNIFKVLPFLFKLAKQNN